MFPSESQQEPEIRQRVDNYNMPQPRGVDDSLMKHILDHELAIKSLEWKLRSEYFDKALQKSIRFGCSDKKQYPVCKDCGEINKRCVRPLLRDEGIYRILTLVEGYMTKHTTLANLDENYIMDLIRESFAPLVFHLLWLHYIEWEVCDIRMTATIIRDSVYANLSRAMNFNTSKLINTTSYKEERVVQQHANQGTGLSRLKFW